MKVRMDERTKARLDKLVDDLGKLINTVDTLYLETDDILTSDGDLSDQLRAALSVLKMGLHTYSDNLEMRKKEIEEAMQGSRTVEEEEVRQGGGSEGKAEGTD